MFDGQMLYCIRNLGTLSLRSERKMDGASVEVTVRCVGKVEPEEDIYFQFYNLIVRKCLFGMELEQMGRNFFDRHAAINIPSHRLTLWPGYVTAMRAHEKEILLCVEVTHKVLRLDSVLTVLNGMKNQRDFKKQLGDDLVGTIVMTSYNRKTYKVEDIEWTVTPSHTFDCKGTPVTYADYYQTRYQITLKDMTQPMLVAQPDKRDVHKGHVGPIYLVPELCQMTGLSDAMRANFSLMKDLSQHLHMVPAKRVTAVTNFMRRLQGSPDVCTRSG
jgi:aubergine-like protein